MSAAVVAEIAMLLAKGLVSGIGSKIGAIIFDEIFPSGVPSYFTEVYKEIERIVHQEITQNTIDEIDGQINGLADWVKNVYTPRKQMGVPKQELYDMMLPKESDIAIHMIGVLQQKAFAESALAVFVIGAGMHLVLLQELALVDPEAAPDDSSYVTSVKKYASEYADYAVKTHDVIIEKRTDESVITPVLTTMNEYPPFPPEAPRGSHIAFVSKWKDVFTGQEFGDATDVIMGNWTNGTLPELESRSAAERDKYIANVKTDLSKAMNDPVGVSLAWRQLINHPLPNH